MPPSTPRPAGWSPPTQRMAAAQAATAELSLLELRWQSTTDQETREGILAEIQAERDALRTEQTLSLGPDGLPLRLH